MGMGNLVEGLVVTFIGIVIVMSVLCIIAIILSVFKYIDREANASVQNTEPIEIKPLEEMQPVQEQETDNLELIAVITAVIAESMNTTTDKLVVRSFRRASSWNEEAIHEQQKSNLF